MARRGQFNRSVAEAIVERRKEVRKTQEQVWTAAGYSKPAYRRLEQARTAWTAEDIRAIAMILGTTSDEVMKSAEERFARHDGDGDGSPLRAALGFD